MSILYIKDKDGKFVPIKTIKGKDGKSAYESALEGGFVGTYEEFCQAIAELTPNAELTPYAKHFNNKNNPHGVTAKQVGAIPEVYYFSDDLNTELTQGGNKMTVCYYNASTLNTPYSEELSDYAHGMVITNAHTEQYGTQLCLPSGDDSMYLRSLNKLGITEWNKISYKDFENTVKKTGDTITGAMTVKKSSDWGQFVIETPEGYYRSYEADDIRMRLDVRDTTETENRRFLDLYSNSGESDLSKALRIAQVNDGKVTTATLLHTNNKPSGTYIGNGEAREIVIGGVGGVLMVWGEDDVRSGSITYCNYLITPCGAFTFYSDGINDFGTHQFDAADIKFENGRLIIGFDYNDFIVGNSPGVTYSYQVL